MASIVTVDAGEKGRLLCEVWAGDGHHSTSQDRGDFADAEVVLFGGLNLEQLARAEASLIGKIIVDCGNPLGAMVKPTVSRTEALAQAYPGARIVKAFNTISAEAIAYVLKHGGIEIGSVYTSGFYCGDDDEAKAIVAGLIAEAKLDPIDCGSLANVHLLDSIGLLERYLSASVFDSWFAITVVRDATDRSPLDRLF
jgi:8-hydroxy-5-deazaflavin:NADPH oxidoreductase